MADGLERQIFEAAGQPEPEIPADQVDSVVSQTIQGLDRAPPGPSVPQVPPQRRPSGQPDPLEGLDDRSTGGLLRALMDERDKRRDALQQLSRYQEQERSRQGQEQRPKLSEALFSDTDGTLERLRQEWTQPIIEQIAQVRLDSDFRAAHARHGETFEKAWQTWYAAVEGGRDAQSYFQVMNAPSPGEAVVQWHRTRELMELSNGGDMDALRQRIINEYLAQTGAHGAAPPAQEAGGEPARAPNGQFVARPQAPQRLPTATSRLGGSGDPSGDDDDLNDGSDAAIFAAARPKNRGQRR